MSDASFDVTGIGNAIVDVISKEQESFITDLTLNKGSMALINEERAEFLYQKMNPAIQASGGSAGNTMAGIASLGGRGNYLGKVKNDALGRVFTHDLRAVGCRYETKWSPDGPATGRCLIVVTPDAQRTMNTFLGASHDLTPEDIIEEEIKASKITYLEGYLWDPKPCKDAFIKASEIARKAGRLVALTLSDYFCVKRHQKEFQQLVRDHIDILFANESEIKALYDCSFEEAAQIVSNQCRYVCLTRGRDGAELFHEGQHFKQSALKVPNVVDTTGAGDLYAAGFLYGITNGYSVEQSGYIAMISAAEVISHVGPRPQILLSELIAEKLVRPCA